MRILSAVILLLFSLPLLAQTLVLSSEQSSAVATAAQLARLPAMKDLMVAFERQPQGALFVYHGSAPAARRLAEQLRGHLIALGLPGARIVVEPRGELAERVLLEVRSDGARP